MIELTRINTVFNPRRNQDRGYPHSQPIERPVFQMVIGRNCRRWWDVIEEAVECKRLLIERKGSLGKFLELEQKTGEEKQNSLC